MGNFLAGMFGRHRVVAARETADAPAPPRAPEPELSPDVVARREREAQEVAREAERLARHREELERACQQDGWDREHAAGRGFYDRMRGGRSRLEQWVRDTFGEGG